MKNVYNRITLDVDDMTSQLSISLKQGDSARGLIVTLVKDGKLFEIGNDCYAVFSAKKEGGTFIGEGCTVRDNKIIYEYSEAFIYLSGRVDCDFTIYDSENKRIASPMFSAFLFGTVMEEYASEVVNSNSFTILENLIEEANDVITRVERTEDTVSTEENKRRMRESARDTDEKARVEAENNRSLAEDSREQTHNQMINLLDNIAAGDITVKNATFASKAPKKGESSGDEEKGKAFLFENTNGFGIDSPAVKGYWRVHSFKSDVDNSYYTALTPSYASRQYLGSDVKPIRRVYTNLLNVGGSDAFTSPTQKYTSALKDSGYYYFEHHFGKEIHSFGILFWDGTKDFDVCSSFVSVTGGITSVYRLAISKDGSVKLYCKSGTENEFSYSSPDLLYRMVWSV